MQYPKLEGTHEGQQVQFTHIHPATMRGLAAQLSAQRGRQMFLPISQQYLMKVLLVFREVIQRIKRFLIKKNQIIYKTKIIFKAFI